MHVSINSSSNSLREAFSESPSLEEEVEFKKLQIVEELLQFMKRNGINRSELASRMGVVPGRITKLLNGKENLTIETLIRAGLAVGASLEQTFIPSGQSGEWIGIHQNRIPTHDNKGSQTAFVKD